MKRGKKKTGGKYHKARKKKLYELPGQERKTKLGEERRRTKRTKGGNSKTFLLKAKVVNVIANGKKQRIEIKNVLETPSNKFLARQNIITQGTILDTSLGRVKVTNRPSQEGMVNGILVE